jgi:hypothetical protein
MATAVVLLALAAYIAGLMTSREPLEYFWDKLNEGVDILVDATRDLILAIWAGLRYIAEILVLVILLIMVIWYEGILPALLAMFRFIRKWWWVPVVAAAAYLLIWWLTSTAKYLVMSPDLWSFVAFMVMAVLVFWLAIMIMARMPVIVLFLLGVFALLAGLVMLAIIGGSLYGLAMILGALVGIVIAMLASIGSVIMKWVVAALMALALLLPSLIPSCGEIDGIKIPQISPEVPVPPQTAKSTPPPAPFTVVSEAFAHPGDGCITLLDRLGVTEEVSKRDLGTDRLSWCVANAQKAGRLTYWHSDPKRWEAPRVCLNELPGKDTQPERWMLVIWPDGSSGIVMPPDSPLCTPRP